MNNPVLLKYAMNSLSIAFQLIFFPIYIRTLLKCIEIALVFDVFLDCVIIDIISFSRI